MIAKLFGHKSISFITPAYCVSFPLFSDLLFGSEREMRSVSSLPLYFLAQSTQTWIGLSLQFRKSNVDFPDFFRACLLLKELDKFQP
ncbi:hypothetical protein CDAR_86071 [Caerostris darwini]|uniref:Uncharacterized protein n=1 Tax=Caerostris darwini TaxID=1538125 RepID=A0AAV4PXZ7_9ARAC|nr:hypothetical protein CDAR_86071 [Caerostris darwini]